MLAGECDFVSDLAAPLPMAVIGDMLGVPPSERATLLEWSDDMVKAQGGNVSEELLVKAAEAAAGYHAHVETVIASRRREATDDLMSILVHSTATASTTRSQEHVPDGEGRPRHGRPGRAQAHAAVRVGELRPGPLRGPGAVRRQPPSERPPGVRRRLADGPLPRRAANFISGIESMPVRFTPTAPVG